MNSFNTKTLINACVAGFLASYLYISLEWLFFATKPSMLNYLETSEQLSVLITAPLALAIFSILATLAMIPLLLINRLPIKKYTFRYVNLASLIPAFIISCTEFILLENFTYTLFSIGVSSFTNDARLLHTFIFIAIFIYNIKLISKLISENSPLTRFQIPLFWSCIVLFVFSFAGVVHNLTSNSSGMSVFKQNFETVKANYKNVLIFSSDGIDAKNMSAYGYPRPTTPFISSLLNESLKFENHFTNSAKTTGSVGSMLSGKYPTTTRVIYRPDIFTQIHSFQHIPGYLRKFGFENGDISIRHYVDPYDLNLRESFHYANGRNLDEEGLPLPVFFRRGLTSTTLFLEEVFGRITSRLLHISGIRTMYNPYLAVTQPAINSGRKSDRERMDELKQFINKAGQPFFAHMHLMNTHGAKFLSDKKVFTVGRKQTEKWDKDFYDDAILQYDRYVEEIVTFLRQQDLLDNTLLILNTDHGFRWSIDRSLPLIIRYPNAEHTGTVKINTQRLDIAPTILDYLNIPIPDWVDGEPLLNITRGEMEPIYVTNRMPSRTKHGWRIVDDPKPPFYTLGSLHAIYCDRIYSLDLITDKFSVGRIEDHTQPCLADKFPTQTEIHRDLIAHLRSANYDVSGLHQP